MQENLPSELPLPDPVAVRRVAIPDAAPPYDDEPQPRDSEPQAAAEEPHAAAHEPEPGGPPADERPPDDRPGPSGSGPGARASSETQPWPSQFAQVLAETLAGARPATQLRPWTTEQTRQRIRQLGPMLATGQRPRVRRIMTSAPSPGVLEMTAVVGFGSRVRVLALRLERAEEACPHWRCTAIESA